MASTTANRVNYRAVNVAETKEIDRSNELATTNELMAMAQKMTSVGHWYFDLRTREHRWSDEVSGSSA